MAWYSVSSARIYGYRSGDIRCVCVGGGGGGGERAWAEKRHLTRETGTRKKRGRVGKENRSASEGVQHAYAPGSTLERPVGAARDGASAAATTATAGTLQHWMVGLLDTVYMDGLLFGRDGVYRLVALRIDTTHYGLCTSIDGACLATLAHTTAATTGAAAAHHRRRATHHARSETAHHRAKATKTAAAAAAHQACARRATARPAAGWCAVIRRRARHAEHVFVKAASHGAKSAHATWVHATMRGEERVIVKDAAACCAAPAHAMVHICREHLVEKLEWIHATKWPAVPVAPLRGRAPRRVVRRLPLEAKGL